MPTILFAYLFLTVAAVVAGKAARESMLLAQVAPVYLALLDAATLAAVLVAFTLQSRARGRLTTRGLLALSPVGLVAGDVALACACREWPGVGTALTAYVWLGVQASFSSAHAALLASGPVRRRVGACGSAAGAGAILGWIGGGVLTQAVARTFGAESLLLAVAVLTLGMPLLVMVSVLPDPWVAAADEEPPVRAPFFRLGPAGVWRSPHLQIAAGLTLCSAAASSLAAFQFRSAAVLAAGGADALAAFLGSFQVWAGLVALCVHLASGWVLPRLGRGVDLMLAPCTTAAAALLVLASGTLGAAVLLRGSDQVFRYSLDRAARDRLYGLVPTSDVVDGRTFIDAAVVRMGDAAGTFIAIVAVLVLHVPASWLSLPMLVLAIACVALAARSRLLPDSNPGS